MEILIVQTIIMPSGNFIKLLGGFFMSNEKWLKEIQDRIEYRFRNQDLLLQAFTRRSYSEENGGSDNEILEFIGDRALDLAVTRILMR